jgi:hypothetical protein
MSCDAIQYSLSLYVDDGLKAESVKPVIGIWKLPGVSRPRGSATKSAKRVSDASAPAPPAEMVLGLMRR